MARCSLPIVATRPAEHRRSTTPRLTARTRPDFPLNKPEFQGASILVAGRNFGCGSSREHAVWAIAQAGFRAVIAPGKGEGFADIFEGNAYQNGLLPIELAENEWAEIAAAGLEPGGAEVTIDLRSQTLTLHRRDRPVNRLSIRCPRSPPPPALERARRDWRDPAARSRDPPA